MSNFAREQVQRITKCKVVDHQVVSRWAPHPGSGLESRVYASLGAAQEARDARSGACAAIFFSKSVPSIDMDVSICGPVDVAAAGKPFCAARRFGSKPRLVNHHGPLAQFKRVGAASISPFRQASF